MWAPDEVRPVEPGSVFSADVYVRACGPADHMSSSSVYIQDRSKGEGEVPGSHAPFSRK